VRPERPVLAVSKRSLTPASCPIGFHLDGNGILRGTSRSFTNIFLVWYNWLSPYIQQFSKRLHIYEEDRNILQTIIGEKLLQHSDDWQHKPAQRILFFLISASQRKINLFKFSKEPSFSRPAMTGETPAAEYRLLPNRAT